MFEIAAPDCSSYIAVRVLQDHTAQLSCMSALTRTETSSDPSTYPMFDGAELIYTDVSGWAQFVLSGFTTMHGRVTATLYSEGGVRDGITVQNCRPLPKDAELRVGGGACDIVWGFSGSIADVQVYNFSMTADHVGQLRGIQRDAPPQTRNFTWAPGVTPYARALIVIPEDTIRAFPPLSGFVPLPWDAQHRWRAAISPQGTVIDSGTSPIVRGGDWTTWVRGYEALANIQGYSNSVGEVITPINLDGAGGIALISVDAVTCQGATPPPACFVQGPFTLWLLAGVLGRAPCPIIQANVRTITSTPNNPEPPTLIVRSINYTHASMTLASSTTPGE
jgi:hypothetical protein